MSDEGVRSDYNVSLDSESRNQATPRSRGVGGV